MIGHAELAVALGFFDGAAELESVARHLIFLIVRQAVFWSDFCHRLRKKLRFAMSGNT